MRKRSLSMTTTTAVLAVDLANVYDAPKAGKLL